MCMQQGSDKKIVSREKLAEIVRELKQQGKRIVSTNGSFDLLHIGHVTMLREAKSLGDALIVGVNSDTGIQRYKGKYRPICPQAHRVGMLAALACTDYITLFDELTPIELLKVIQPHIHVNSPEHGENCVEREVVERYGGRIHLAQLVEGMSTTQLLQRIMASISHPPRYAVFINAESIELPNNLEEFRSLFAQFTQMGFSVFLLISGEKHSIKDQLLDRLKQQGVTVYSEMLSLADAVEQIAQEHDVVLAKSVIISGKMADILAGREANCKTILLVSSGTDIHPLPESAGPHAVAETLQKTVNILRTL